MVRKTRRPIRPNPLIPIFTAISKSSSEFGCDLTQAATLCWFSETFLQRRDLLFPAVEIIRVATQVIYSGLSFKDREHFNINPNLLPSLLSYKSVAQGPGAFEEYIHDGLRKFYRIMPPWMIDIHQISGICS